MRITAETLQADEDASGLAALGGRLENAVNAVESAGAWLSERRNEADGLAGATPYLTLIGDVIGGWLLAKGAMAAARGGPDPAYGAARIGLATHYAETVLTQAPGRVAGIIVGAHVLKTLDATALGA